MEGRKRAALGACSQDGARAPEDAIAAGLDAARVNAAMAKLPEAFREVITLCACEGLGADDAAAVLDITPEAARKRLSRARAALAALMDERPRDERRLR